MTAIISVRNLTKRFGPVTALNALTFDLERGRVVGLFGENGCGKTTLLRILAGMSFADTGTATIAGSAPGARTKALVSYLPDTPAFPGGARVRALIKYMADFYADFDADACRAMLLEMGVSSESRVGELSKGQREKVQVALTMARKAEVYLLDEPLSGVDPLARDATLRAIIAAVRPEALVVIATHLVNEIEPLLDEVVLMRGGQIVGTGTADELRATHGGSLTNYFREVYSA